MYVEVPHRRSHDHGSKSEFTKPKNELSIDKLTRISNEIELKPVISKKIGALRAHFTYFLQNTFNNCM